MQRIDDTDPDCETLALFVCGNCAYANIGRENAPPTYCGGCARRMGKNIILAGRAEEGGVLSDEEIESLQDDIRSGQADRSLKKRLQREEDEAQ